MRVARTGSVRASWFEGTAGRRAAAVLLLLACGTCSRTGPTGGVEQELSKESYAHSLHLQHHFVALYQRVLPATVSVVVSERVLGAGFFADADGHVITCRHVVAGQQGIRVRQGRTQREWPATIVQQDPAYDLALLKVESDTKESVQRTSIAVPQVATPSPGALFVGIGSPHGLPETMISGHVAFSLREGADPSQPHRGFVQLSVPVLPGASGGPVVGMDGSLLGVMRFTLTPFGRGTAGPGFAIPASHVYTFLSRQASVRAARREALRGIVPIPLLTPHLVEKLNLPGPTGVLVSFVESPSPAEMAGIRRYDLILAVEGRPVLTEPELFRSLEVFRDRPVRLLVFREGRKFESTLPAWPTGAVRAER